MKLQIRREERRDTALAFMTLFAVMFAHAQLETARDAMFLAEIPAVRLPIVYLAVATLAFFIAWAQSKQRAESSTRNLSRWLAVAAIVTFGLSMLTQSDQPWTLYVLYIWSAIAVSTVVTHFFVALGDRFSVTQAKRLYAFIGLGSATGAIAGSFVASVVTEFASPHHLVAIAAGALLVSALFPWLLDSSGTRSEREAGAGQLRLLLAVFTHGYARRVGAIVVTATLTFTIVDYVFKSVVAESMRADQLGFFFARFYLGLNILSLLTQAVLVRFVVRSLSVAAALAILPTLLLLGGAGVGLGAVFVGALALKGADGALRHSVHGTLKELLYLPLQKPLRAATKIAVDLLGQRLGQAAASFALLVAVGLGATPMHLGWAVVAAALAWAVQALALRPHYFMLYRDSLAAAAERSPRDFPELDISSLESLMAALNSNADSEVRAALSFLEDEGRIRAIPSLILFHPSPPVVVDALDIFARSERTDFLPITERLLGHEYAEVRAAALRTRISKAPEEELLIENSDRKCPVVRATALGGLRAGGFIGKTEAQAHFDEIAATGSEIAKEALAKAIAYRPNDDFEETLVRLLQDDSPLVVGAALEAIKLQPSARFLPALLPLLKNRKLRPTVRDSLHAIGEPAFQYLVGVLRSEEADDNVRLHVPRSLIHFDPEKASHALLESLGPDTRGTVRYKSLRGLGQLATEHPKLRLDRPPLNDFVTRTLREMFRSIDWRLALTRGAQDSAERNTEAHSLLVSMLEDKERNAMERLFRTLALLFPDRELTTIYRGIQSGNKTMVANGREVLEEFLPAALKRAVLALTDDDAGDDERLSGAGEYYQRSRFTYEQVLRELLHSRGEFVRGLSVYQIEKLQLSDLAADVARMSAPPDSFLEQVIQRSSVSLPPQAGVTK
jgi:ATP:ADP antiporter, AAA family